MRGQTYLLLRRGDDLSVSAELVDAREDKQLWGEQYRRKLADIASIQPEIATAISANLRVRLSSEEKTRLNKSSATNPEAYELYLKGRYHANQATAEGLKKSIGKQCSFALAGVDNTGVSGLWCELVR